VVHRAEPGAGNQDEGVFFGDLRRTDRGFRRFDVIRQRIIAQLLENGGIELDFAGWRCKTLGLAGLRVDLRVTFFNGRRRPETLFYGKFLGLF